MKKLILSTVAVMLAAFMLAACTQNGTNQNKTESKTESSVSGVSTPEKEIYKEVGKQTMPTDTDLTLTRAEMEAKYRPYTDWRISVIRTTKTDVKITGKSYYVSEKGDDSNDGTSPEKAIKSVDAIAKFHLQPGDAVLFERGSVFRGHISCAVDGVTYSAYGAGNKPEIYGASENAAKVGTWEKTDTENVWVYSAKSGLDVGVIVFDEGKEFGLKVFGKKTHKDLKKNYQFTCERGSLYLYLDKGSPSDLFYDIEICRKQNLISINRCNNITIDNLCLKYTGLHGIGAESCKGLTVQNCEIAFIGGSLQTESVRYGNAVEIYGKGEDYTVTNNYIYQVYDTGITIQFKGDTKDICHKNIKFADNVIENCTYSIEYFLTAGEPEDSYMQNFQITGNLCWYAGEGLGEQRTDKKVVAQIKSWGHNNYSKDALKIENNLFALSKYNLLETTTKGKIPPVYNNNIYIQFQNKKLGLAGTTGEIVPFNKDSVTNHFGDKNAKIITVTD